MLLFTMVNPTIVAFVVAVLLTVILILALVRISSRKRKNRKSAVKKGENRY